MEDTQKTGRTWLNGLSLRVRQVLFALTTYVLLLLSAGGLLGGIAGMLLSLPLYVCARGAVRALQCAARENAP